jgi:hypothetical protein
MTPTKASAPDELPAEDVSSPADEIEDALAAARSTERVGPRLGLPPWLRGEKPVVTYIGVAVAMIGFVLILVAWGQVAGETQVYLQVPYLVSAGLTGLGLVMVGLTVVNVAAKARDAADRDRQMDQLVSILGELKATIAGEEDSDG